MSFIDQQKVLVLNSYWDAVGFCSIRRAITVLFSTYKDGSPKAKILRPLPVTEEVNGVMVETTKFEDFSWSDWSALKPNENDAVIHVRRGETILLPRTIVLLRYDKCPHRKIPFNRKTIYKRDGHRCQYCGCKPGDGELTIDHIIPKCQGGKSSWDNVVLACIQCNSQKAGRRPEEAHRSLLSRPQQKLWRGPSPMKLLSVPHKPKTNFFKGDRKFACKDWSHFVSELYWSIELANDEPKE